MFKFLKKIKMVPIHQISVEELKEKLKNNEKKQLIDVRTKNEFRGSHIRGFINIPLHTLEQNQKKIDREISTYVICQSGGRSGIACKELKKLGCKNIINVRGGMDAWEKFKKEEQFRRPLKK